MEYRMEHDTLGSVEVPANRLWGAQTQRSLQNFPIGNESDRMPREIIKALLIIKAACAKINRQFGLVPQDIADAVASAALRLYENTPWEDFPLQVWQTGSGTQTNMNVNEVIARVASDTIGRPVHPNDHVNRSQSTNDVFPSAVHLASLLLAERRLLPAGENLAKRLESKARRYSRLIKIGRTHMQDATPVTLGQEIGGWAASVRRNLGMIATSLELLRPLALGGTAVGTGLNAPANFGLLVATELTEFLGTRILSERNKFHALSSRGELCAFHGVVRTLAADVFKIACDVRLLASGPRCGFGELVLPANEPGSSIMPGKVNPTQCEAITQIAIQIMANDVAVSIASSQGALELNTYMPLLARNVLSSCQLLADGMQSFAERCIVGITANEKQISRFVGQSLMVATALTPVLGYEKVAALAKLAYENDSSIRETVLADGALTAEQYDQLMMMDRLVGRSMGRSKGRGARL